MKKIAFIMGGDLPMPPTSGGAVCELVNTLITSDKINKKYKIDVYSNGNSNNYKDGNISYYYVDNNKIEKTIRFTYNKLFKKYIGNSYISRLIRKYKDNLKNYDYVIVENKPEYGLILKKYINGKLILHSHNDLINRKRINDSLNCFDRIFVVSNYMSNRISNSNVRVLYNGIDVDNFNINLDEREKYGLKKSDIIFLYTGRIVKHKGIRELIEAFNKIKKDNYKLLIVGSIGYGKNTTSKYLKELKKVSNKNIIYTGYINYSEINKLYKIADYGVIPSIWEEPFGMVVIENLAAGNPVIITNSGGMEELVNDKCSIVVNKENNLVNNLYKAMIEINDKFNSKDCVKQAKKYTKEKYIDRFIELIEEMK